MEGTFSLRGTGDCQVTYPHINSYHVFMSLGSRVSYLDFKSHQQVELFLGFVIPQLGCPDVCTLPYQGNVLVIAGVANNETTLKGEKAHLVFRLEGVVLLVLVRPTRCATRWGESKKQLSWLA
jgi:hypothetical protein